MSHPLNKPLATPTIMREVFAALNIPNEVAEALVAAAKYATKRSPTSETMAQMFVSVGRSEGGLSSLKMVVSNPFKHDYLRNDYHKKWKGIKAAQQRKLLKEWSRNLYHG